MNFDDGCYCSFSVDRHKQVLAEIHGDRESIQLPIAPLGERALDLMTWSSVIMQVQVWMELA